MEALAPFGSEREMALPATRWLARRGYVVRSEFQTAQGISDLVGCRWRRGAVQERSKFARPLLSSKVRTALLAVIPPEGIRQTEVVKALRCFSRAIVHEELKNLHDWGLVARSKNARWQREAHWLPMHDHLVAIELKMRHLREAVRQAQRYLAFADDAYVGFPWPLAFRIAKDRRSEILRMAGVGLLAIRPARVQALIEPAPGHRPWPVERATQLQTVDRIWRTTLAHEARAQRA